MKKNQKLIITILKLTFIWCIPLLSNFSILAQADLEITHVEILSYSTNSISYCAHIKNVGDQVSILDNNEPLCSQGVSIQAYLRVYADENTHSNDAPAGGTVLSCNPGVLQPGETFIKCFSATVNLDADITPFLEVYLIPFGLTNVSDTNADNNSGFATINPSQDFTIIQPRLSKSSALAGENFVASGRQLYQGFSLDPLKVKMHYYWSEDDVLDISDVLLARDYSWLSYFDIFENERARLKVPDSASPGIYYILFQTDKNNDLMELDENNNVTFIQLEVLAPESAAGLNIQDGNLTASFLAAQRLKEIDSAPLFSSGNIEEGILVYPNPFEDVITIDLGLNENRIINIRFDDITGKTVWKQRSLDHTIISCSPNLQPGIYILILENQDGVVTHKKIQKI